MSSVNSIHSKNDLDASTGVRGSNGGFKFTNEAFVEKQKKATMQFIKGLPKQFFDGKDLVNVSLPVEIFESRSFLERVSDGWCHMCLLRQAAASEDPIERFKNVIAFAFSGLCNTCRPQKPFNPILGETWQASFPDGKESIFCEQTSHHPPISHWQVEAEDGSFHFWGYGGWTGSWRGNSVKGHQIGPSVVEFKDGGRIEWNLPYLYLRGIIMGERGLDYEGTMQFRDYKNNLMCDLTINPDSGVGMFKKMFGSVKKRPTDCAVGIVSKIAGKGDKGQDLPGDEIATIEGGWLEHLSVDGKKLWEYQVTPRSEPQGIENPLPSDCRFREDLVALREDRVEEAQALKEKLENIQRNDKKLRQAALK